MGEQHGGKLLGLGSFGCVFRPEIQCSSQKTVSKDRVSKIFFGKNSKKEANFEITIDKEIRSIQGYEKWAIVWDKKCLPKKYSELVKQDKSIEECVMYDNRISEDEFNKTRQMLQGEYAGIPLTDKLVNSFKKKDFVDKSSFSKHFLEIMKQMKPLFIGLKAMYDNKLTHTDIKSDNIMLNNGELKYIDFGLANKMSNRLFYKNRSMLEFLGDRIYIPYPYEFIYLFAKQVIDDEISDLEYDIFRASNEYYDAIHDELFNRGKTKPYLINLSKRCISGKLIKQKNDIISLIDTYSVGVLIPIMLYRIAKSMGHLRKFKEYCKDSKIKPFMDLFKQMCEPDHFNRINPDNALKQYTQLYEQFLTDKPKLKPKPKQVKRTVRRKRS